MCVCVIIVTIDDEFSFQKGLHSNSLKIVRLLLLRGANPFELDKENGTTPFDRAEESAKRELETYLENPNCYRSSHSALIALAVGLVSLDLPVLIVTLISEYLVLINEEKLFGEYAEQKSWNVAALIKKKAKIEL